jgi:glucose/arabinose dehydrogenase
MRPIALAVLLACLAAVPCAAQIRADVVASGLAQPLAFVQDPSDPSVQYIAEQGGRVRVLQGGVLESAAFLDLSTVVSTGGERGLLGLAFPPDYGASGRFYVNFTNPNGDTVVARFKRSAGNPLAADPSSRFDLQWPSGDRFIAQPFANHNGGNIVFGPDGYLYVGMGDGGSADDPGHRAQDPRTLVGKMLRIDVSVADGDTRGYRVPADNPFVAGGPAGTFGEIWAFGLRNPWRFSFDDPRHGGTGALVIADVGQGAWEEIDYEPAGRGGRNYGWRNREGAHDNVTSLPPAFTPLAEPVFEYSHAVGDSITGGFAYRGAALGLGIAGRYFFADFVAGRVWSLGLVVDPVTREATASGLVEHTAELGGSSALGLISSFGVDADGELYLVSWSAGRILRLASATQMYIDAPTGGATVGQPLRLAGWAIDPAAGTGTGVDAIHVWAYPNPGSGAPPTFAGSGTANRSRPDVAAAFGSRFADSGFDVPVSGLAPGVYQLVVYARSTVTGTFNNARTVTVTVRGGARMAVDLPRAGTAVAQPFAVAGWAFDSGAAAGSGIDAVHVWAYPNPGSGAPPVFLGAAATGLSRPDVGAAFGAQFASSGYGLTAAGLPPGLYQLVVYAHSLVSGAFDAVQSVNVTVEANARMAVDLPANGSSGAQPFTVAGWALDLAAASGTGVDAVHVWAVPASGAAPVFLGVAGYGTSRPDVGTVFGSRFIPSGYGLSANGLASGAYQVVVYAHSSVTNSFSNAQGVAITVR